MKPRPKSQAVALQQRISLKGKNDFSTCGCVVLFCPITLAVANLLGNRFFVLSLVY
jgi:hypothetical protein